MRSMPRVARQVRRVAGYLLVAAAFVVMWPSSLGGCTTTVMVSGVSMRPTYVSGDAVIARCGAPHLGDVVVYRPPDVPGVRVIHRIVGGSRDGWVLQGDNNPGIDPFRPTNDDVIGIALLRVPKVGAVLHVLTTPYVWLLLIGAGLGTALWPRRRTAPPGETATSA